MNIAHFRDLIRRAAAAPDGQVLDMLAAKLHDAERAASIMQAKGYRADAKSLSAVVRLVPIASQHRGNRYAPIL